MKQNNHPVLLTTLLLAHHNAFADGVNSSIVDGLIAGISRNKEQVAELAIGLFILVGLLFAVFALRSFLRVSYLLKHGKTTSGKVINLERVGSAGNTGRIKTLYAPKIRFYTDIGRQVEFTSTIADRGANGPKYDIGSEVPVRYDPRDPINARMDTTDRMWLSTAILSGFGGIFLLIGLTFAYSNNMLREVTLDSIETSIINIFSTPERVPVELFPEFVAAAPLPTWWNQVRVSDKIIHNYDDLQAVWASGTYVGPKLKASARRMFKVGYLTILHNADDDFLVAEAIVRMDIIAMDNQYPPLVTMLEFALDRYFYHNKPIDKCSHCMYGDTIAYIARSLASNYNSHDRYDDTIAMIDNLISKRGHEISDYVQADLYDIYAYALWRRGDKELAVDTLKMALGKWKDTINGKYLQRDLDRYSKELIKQQR